jgi:endonuclease YncB( thermonuclease family)
VSRGPDPPESKRPPCPDERHRTARNPEPFVYRLKAVAKVVDGATMDLDLDLGFSITLRQRVRLYGLDAPEIRSKNPAEKAKGQESQAFVSQWFQQPGPVLVRTQQRGEVRPNARRLLPRGRAEPLHGALGAGPGQVLPALSARTG